MQETPYRQAERLSASLKAASARPEVLSATSFDARRIGVDCRHHLRLDSLPPSSGSGMNASRKMELPPSKKDNLKAPSKKSGTTVKKEKPKQTPPKVKGAERWQDCPVEFLKYAKEGLVSARVSIPGPGFVLKEAASPNPLFITEAPDVFEKLDSEPSATSLDKLPSTPPGTGRDKSPGTRKNSSSTVSKSKRISSQAKGKSK